MQPHQYEITFNKRVLNFRITKYNQNIQIISYLFCSLSHQFPITNSSSLQLLKTLMTSVLVCQVAKALIKKLNNILYMKKKLEPIA